MKRGRSCAIRAARVILAAGLGLAVAGGAATRGLADGRAGHERGRLLAADWAQGQPGEWFLIRPDGTHRRSLPRDMVAARMAPDGAKLAFGCYPKLCVSAADGSHRRVVATPRLCRDCGNFFVPVAWSPRGRLAYSDARGVWTVAADGTDRRLVVRLPKLSAGEIAWSSGGRMIAFGRDLDFRNEESVVRGSIYVVNADGSAFRRLTTGTGPSFSPDARLLVFSDTRRVTRTDTFIFDLVTRKRRRLARGAYSAAGAFSPDGRTILLQVGPAIAVIGRDGGSLQLLGPGQWPAWSPDGRRIAFARDGLEVMDAHGGGKRVVARTPGQVGTLQWTRG